MNKMKLNLPFLRYLPAFLLSTLLILLSTGFGSLDTQSTCVSGFTGNVPSGSEYVLVWSDEFGIDGEVCGDNWHFQTQCLQGQLFCWANNEFQHYTDRSDNAFVENGNLKIIAKREDFNDQGQDLDYTSARLNSKFAFTYGRVDVRAKLPAELGTWPAIWMLGKNISEAGAFWAEDFGTTPWPATGEIDIMEQFGRNSAEKIDVHGTTHTPAGFGGNANGDKTSAPTSTTEFHVYSIIWDENEIQFLYDDVAYYTYNPVTIYGSKNADNWPFDEPQFLLLNIAMGGVLGGDVPASFTDATMEIDYVRVYQNYDEGFVAEIPEIAAENPTEEGSAVISIYSDSYTSIEGVNLDPEGDQGTIVSELEIDGNQVLKYSNLDNQLIDFNDNSQDLSAMSSLHINYWTVNTTELEVSLIDSNDNESAAYSISITNGCWVDEDIPLTDFSASVDLTDITQIKIEGNGNIYLDNIYFIANDDLQSPTSAAPEPTEDAENVISLFSEAYSTITGVNYNPALGQSTVASLVSINGNSTLKYTNLDFQGIGFEGNPQDVSGLAYLHIDYWTSTSRDLSFSLKTTESDGSDYSLETTPLLWVSLDIELSEFASLEELTEVVQLTISGSGTIFLDNVYFHSESSSGVTPQEISFTSIEDVNLSEGSFMLEADASSGLVVTFSSTSNKISIEGSTVNLLSPGVVVITAEQAGNNIYEAAPPVSQSFCVIPSKPEITITSVDDQTFVTSSSAVGNQWFLNGARLTSQINQELQVTEDGIYTVSVTVDGCRGPLSDDLPIIITSTEGIEQQLDFFPNPITSTVHFRTSETDLNFQLTSVSGQVYPIVFEKGLHGYRANLERIPIGIFIVTIKSRDNIRQVKIIKK